MEDEDKHNDRRRRNDPRFSRAPSRTRDLSPPKPRRARSAPAGNRRPPLKFAHGSLKYIKEYVKGEDMRISRDALKYLSVEAENYNELGFRTALEIAIMAAKDCKKLTVSGGHMRTAVFAIEKCRAMHDRERDYRDVHDVPYNQAAEERYERAGANNKARWNVVRDLPGYQDRKQNPNWPPAKEPRGRTQYMPSVKKAASYVSIIARSLENAKNKGDAIKADELLNRFDTWQTSARQRLGQLQNPPANTTDLKRATMLKSAANLAENIDYIVNFRMPGVQY